MARAVSAGGCFPPGRIRRFYAVNLKEESETPVEFRKTTECEIDRIMAILMDGKAALGALGIDQWQGPGYPERSIVAADVARGESYAVEDAPDHIAATAMVSFSGEPDYDEIEGAWLTDGTSSAPSYGVVHRVAVGADSLGRGAARFILESAERLAREKGARSVRVDTHPGNVPMLTLVASCGFTECGIIRIKHADGGVPERVAFEKLV